MRTNYVLIDFENVQPEQLSLLQAEHFQVSVFVGSNQNKLHFDIVNALQPLGNRAKYVKISGSGRNALDFHIAYYLGKLIIEDSAGYFYIVSKDLGFDPLIDHLRENKILSRRVEVITDIPLFKPSTILAQEERAGIFREFLLKSPENRPGSLKALGNAIASRFQKKLQPQEIDDLTTALIENRVIALDGTKITYNL